MKLLAFTKYTRIGPSSRLRFYQFIRYFESVGITVQIQPLFESGYIRRLFSTGKRSIPFLLRGYLKRSRKLARTGWADLIWIEKELFPWIPGVEKLILSKVNRPYVVDVDDAVFHLYDQHPKPFLRTVLEDKIGDVMRRASVVTVGNDYLAQYAKRSGADRVEILPTVVDMVRYTMRPKLDQPFTIGWIGTPVTQKYLETIRRPLAFLCGAAGPQIMLVGATADALCGLNPQIVQWTELSEVRSIHGFDVGMMPLQESPFEKGKCGYKLIQCMACGVPVVASPVGVNTTIVDHGENGFLAKNETEWLRYLTILRDDKQLREKMGLNARKKILRKYSLSETGPRFCEILIQAARDY